MDTIMAFINVIFMAINVIDIHDGRLYSEKKCKYWKGIKYSRKNKGDIK